MLARALLVVLGLATVACTRGPDARDVPPNVVVILADTTRADRLSLYGYGRETTPRLARLASSAVVFEAARSQAACTFPSVNSILTSRYPFHFYDQPLGSWAIPAETKTMAEILKGHGYATFAVSASAVVRATPSKVNKVGGYAAGFDVFDESCVDRDAACVSGRAVALTAASQQPFFAYLHFMDPHHPYRPPDAFRHHFAKPIAGDDRLRRGDPGRILTSLYKRKEGRDWSREIAYLSDSYDDEIRYLDFELEHLLAKLRAASDGRDTIVVFASDHGEDFFEHGDLMHCRTLHDTSIHVPLVMWLPGVPGERVATPVQNLDIVPTLLDYLGIDATPYGLEGRSLRANIEGDTTSVPVYSAQSSLRAVVEGDDKLVYDLESTQAQLFDVTKDRAENDDLATMRADRAKALEESLLTRITATEGGGDTRRAERVSRKVQDRLRALGYLE
jgi:arylsulfatase A-like enzyme